MGVKIKLADIVDAIEMQWEETNAILNKQTGDIFSWMIRIFEMPKMGNPMRI
ncbi:hypothetical protein GCM10009001_20790 [Virgibacillus siamensis]|uniref:Uncharacterized protein n=1 Tax=Virgibacillus siamensis TaxID=480071 RepID=A0ABP3R4V3_9BACI